MYLLRSPRLVYSIFSICFSKGFQTAGKNPFVAKHTFQYFSLLSANKIDLQRYICFLLILILNIHCKSSSCALFYRQRIKMNTMDVAAAK